VILLALGLALIFAMGWDKHFSVSALRDHREMLTAFVESRYLISVLVFCAVYVVVTGLSVPGSLVLTVSAGFLFGKYHGAIFSVIGATTGATLLFLAARTAFGEVLKGRAGSAVDRMRAGFQENALFYLLFLRLIPIFPFFLVNLVPALLNVRLATYVVGTFFGIIPGAFVFTLVGSGLGELFERGEVLSLASVLSADIAYGLTGLAILALLPVIYKRVRGTAGPA
jgi:uncharacterized membrane protein YdjX (TVP38/TMEM64 family)